MTSTCHKICSAYSSGLYRERDIMPQNNIIQLVAYQNLLDEVADLL
jgi:hypothetical protein